MDNSQKIVQSFKDKFSNMSVEAKVEYLDNMGLIYHKNDPCSSSKFVGVTAYYQKSGLRKNKSGSSHQIRVNNKAKETFIAPAVQFAADIPANKVSLKHVEGKKHTTKGKIKLVKISEKKG